MSSTADVSLLERAPERRGASIASSTLNLANTIMGTGILGLPFALAGTGYVIGGVFLLVSTAVAMLSLQLLSESARTAGRPATFYSVCEAAYPGLSIAVDIVVILNGSLACLGFLVVAGDSFSKLMVGGVMGY